MKMRRRVVAGFLAILLTCGVMLPENVVYAAENTEVTVEDDSETNAAETTEKESTEEKAETVTEQTESSEAISETERIEETEDDAGITADAKSAVDETVSVDKLEEIEVTNKMKYATSGKCGDNLTWSYGSGVLTISGTGAMYDYPVYDTPSSSQCMPWYNYKSAITTVNIAEGVTTIGACAFWGCSSLTSVTTPATISTIGFGAFCDCSGLQQVTIKAGFVGESAFIRCTALRTVTVGSGVTGFGISAFENCPGLTGVYISDLAAWCRIDFGGYLSNPLYGAKRLYLNGVELTDSGWCDGNQRLCVWRCTEHYKRDGTGKRAADWRLCVLPVQ